MECNLNGSEQYQWVIWYPLKACYVSDMHKWLNLLLSEVNPGWNNCLCSTSWRRSRNDGATVDETMVYQNHCSRKISRKMSFPLWHWWIAAMKSPNFKVKHQCKSNERWDNTDVLSPCLIQIAWKNHHWSHLHKHWGVTPLWYPWANYWLFPQRYQWSHLQLFALARAANHWIHPVVVPLVA